MVTGFGEQAWGVAIEVRFGKKYSFFMEGDPLLNKNEHLSGYASGKVKLLFCKRLTRAGRRR